MQIVLHRIKKTPYKIIIFDKKIIGVLYYNDYISEASFTKGEKNLVERFSKKCLTSKQATK